MQMLSLFRVNDACFIEHAQKVDATLKIRSTANATRCTQDTLKMQLAEAQHATRQRYKRNGRSRNAAALLWRKVDTTVLHLTCVVATLEMLVIQNI